MWHRRMGTAAAGALLAVAIAPPPVAMAQEFLGFGGVDVRAGFAAPEQARSGRAGGLDVDLGYLRTPRLRTSIGIDLFRAGIDRRVEGERVRGNYSARGAVGALRLDAFAEGRFIPFLYGSLNAYSVDATSPNATVEDLLSGFIVGLGVGGGLSYALVDDHRAGATVQLRRVFANNINHWSLQLGLRYLPRGTGTYVRVPRTPAALRQQTEAERRLVDEQEAERAERERQLAAVPAERATDPDTAAARAEAERRAEEERLAEERQRAERAAIERDARERIAAAERETAEARARAEEAERRAAEHERRLYDALLDLDRLITNVTAIRETERGLVVVLGQGLFASGQYQLSPRARDEVGRIAAVLNQFPEHRIVVEGHTDAVGSELANQRLSERRSESVRAALIAEGISPGRVESLGYGQGQPIADNRTAEGRAQNRRVEIVVVGARRPGGG